jgi:hypothetical protein
MPRSRYIRSDHFIDAVLAIAATPVPTHNPIKYWQARRLSPFSRLAKAIDELIGSTGEISTNRGCANMKRPIIFILRHSRNRCVRQDRLTQARQPGTIEHGFLSVAKRARKHNDQ